MSEPQRADTAREDTSPPDAANDDASSSSPSSGEEDEEALLSADIKRAAVGGSVAAVMMLIGTVAVGSTSGAEGQALVQGMVPTTRSLASTTMIASATVLALMLTLLSLSANANSTLKPVYYHRIRHIATLDVSVFITATLFLLVLNLPLEQAENIPVAFYSGMYYANVTVSSLLGGSVIAIVLMLYHTVRDMIRVVGPADEVSLIMNEEEDA